MINYYRDMWRRRSHVLAPLTKLTSGKSKFKWTEKQQSAFEQVRAMVMREAQLAYPNFDKPFEVYADASDYQLDRMIMQAEKSLAFYTRRLNSAQAKYTTGEQELLSIVETLKTIENILLGQQLVVHTDHLNLLYKKVASNWLIRWRMLLEEYAPEFRHVKGEKNVVANALSRLNMEAREYNELETDEKPVQLSYLNWKEIGLEDFLMVNYEGTNKR